MYNKSGSRKPFQICPSKIIWPLISITTCWNLSSNANLYFSIGFNTNTHIHTLIHYNLYLYILLNDRISRTANVCKFETNKWRKKNHMKCFLFLFLSLSISVSLSLSPFELLVNRYNEHRYIYTKQQRAHIGFWNIQYINFYKSETNAKHIYEISYQRISIDEVVPTIILSI